MAERSRPVAIRRESSIGARQRIFNWRLGSSLSKSDNTSSVEQGVEDASSSVTSNETAVVDPTTSAVTMHYLPPVPSQICLILKYLVDFLLKNKLHKNDLFLLDGKPKEKKKLLHAIKEGDLPERLSQYSSRSVSYVVLHLLSFYYAPLVPYDSFADLTLAIEDTSMSRTDQLALVADVLDMIVPEHRALLESIMLLLHKLSLKGSAEMNAHTLGCTVGGVLARPSEDVAELQTCEPTRRAIGTFLVENAPAILRSYQDHYHNVHNHHHHRASSTTMIVSAPLIDDNDEDEMSSHETDDEIHHHAASQKAVSFATATSIVLTTTKNRHHHDPAPTVPSIPSILHRAPLHEQDATRLIALLTSIIQCQESTCGLFVRPPKQLTDLHRAQAYLNSGDDPVTIEHLDVDTLAKAMAVREFLQSRVEPILGFSALTRLDAVDGVEQLVTELVATVKVISIRNQELLLLLLACARLSLEGGTEERHLCAALSPILLDMPHHHHRSVDTRWTARRDRYVCLMLEHMAAVCSPLLEATDRQRKQVIQRRSLTVYVAVRVVCSVIRLKKIVRDKQTQRHKEIETTNTPEAAKEDELVLPQRVEIHRNDATVCPDTAIDMTLSAYLIRCTTGGREQTPLTWQMDGVSTSDSTSIIDCVQRRLDDFLYVMKHCKIDSPTSETSVRRVLSDFDIPQLLLPHDRVEQTLAQIRLRNKQSNDVQNHRLLPLFELLEAMVIATIVTLRHPILAPLYPSIEDKLVVLFDVWGLADRAIVDGRQPQAA